MAATLSSVMLPNCKDKDACPGLLPHMRRVITPACASCVVVNHVGAVKLRAVGSMRGNTTGMGYRDHFCNGHSLAGSPPTSRSWFRSREVGTAIG